MTRLLALVLVLALLTGSGFASEAFYRALFGGGPAVYTIGYPRVPATPSTGISFGFGLG